MPTPLRRRLRIARRGLWYSVAIGLVLMALLAGVTSQLLPLAERHPDHVAAWLSARAGRPVTFTTMETRWTRRGPLLRLDGMRIGSGSNAVVMGDAEMLISQYAGLLPGRSFTELRLHGLDLTVEQGRDGSWSVRGLPGQQQQNGDPFGPLEGLGELQIIGGKLSVVAPALGIDTRLPRVDLRLRVDGQRVRVGARAWARLGASPLLGAVDFYRTAGNGRAYATTRNTDLSVWAPLLHAAGVRVAAGTGRIDAWAELQRHRIAALVVDATLGNVQLRSMASSSSPQVPASARVELTSLRAQLRWRTVAGGWRLDAPLLRMEAASRPQTLDGLVVRGGQHFALLAEHLDAGAALAVAALSDRLAPPVRRWLLAAHPGVTLSNVVLTGSRSGALHANARVDTLSFASVGSMPGVSGMRGWLDGDERGGRFHFDPGSAPRLDWPGQLIGSPELHLAGEIDGWR
ncbi:MAG: hypothetical protein JWL98_2212, partial [Xanthomonadaceae bacterium]|nr:hypothetical protein [Xanthomonadaceae bacterium]